MSRPLGREIPDFRPVAPPRDLHLVGQWAELRPLDAEVDGPALYTQMAGQDWLWDYLYEEAPQTEPAFMGILRELQEKSDKYAYVIRGKGSDAPLGYACYWTTLSGSGSNEIGNVNLSPALQKTPIATDAFYLMNDWVFSNGYRRMEWKCNALNGPSRRAAQRLGFSFEGVFRNHLVVKGRNRDTAWFAITDSDWIDLKPAYNQWLDPSNFNGEGMQATALADLTAPFLYQKDPTVR